MSGRSFFRRCQKPALALMVAIGGSMLAGCEQMPEVNVARGDIRNAIARGELTSPRAATVALVSLEGAPDQVEARFRQMLATEAANREITITDQVSAHYLVRGYLAAYPGQNGGTEVAYVYDVFDAGAKRREQRVDDSIEVPGAPADPWSALSDAALTSLVSRSTDDLAVALAGTPEAQATRGQVAVAGPTDAALTAAQTATPR